MKIFTVCLNYGGKHGLVQGVAPGNSPEQADFIIPLPAPSRSPLWQRVKLFLVQGHDGVCPHRAACG